MAPVIVDDEQWDEWGHPKPGTLEWARWIEWIFKQAVRKAIDEDHAAGRCTVHGDEKGSTICTRRAEKSM